VCFEANGDSDFFAVSKMYSLLLCIQGSASHFTVDR